MNKQLIVNSQFPQKRYPVHALVGPQNFEKVPGFPALFRFYRYNIKR